MPGIAAEAIDLVLIIFSRGNYFGAGTLIPEKAEIVSNLYALSRSQIDVHRVPAPRHLRGVPAADNHSHWLTAYRSENIEGRCIFVRTSGTFHKWTNDVATLHQVATLRDLAYRN